MCDVLDAAGEQRCGSSHDLRSANLGMPHECSDHQAIARYGNASKLRQASNVDEQGGFKIELQQPII